MATTFSRHLFNPICTPVLQQSGTTCSKFMSLIVPWGGEKRKRKKELKCQEQRPKYQLLEQACTMFPKDAVFFKRRCFRSGRASCTLLWNHPILQSCPINIPEEYICASVSVHNIILMLYQQNFIFCSAHPK